MNSHTNKQRSLHVIDIENLAGAEHRNPAALAFATYAYRTIGRIRPEDLVIVGCDRSPAHRLEVGLLWPGVQHVAGGGPDGADRALLAAVDAAWVAGRFGRVVIGSGDGCFAPLAQRLRRARLVVAVMALPGAVSKDLGAEAHSLRFLPRFPDPSNTASRSAA